MKKGLLTVMILGGIAGTTGSTFALLDAEATNVSSTFATGTLTLSNTVNSGTACLEATATSAPASSPPSVSCDALVQATSGPWYPGVPTKATIAITNSGTLDASNLTVFLSGSGCTQGAVAGAYQGGGDPCGAVDIYLQETTASGTPIECYFPTGEGSTCSFTTAGTIDAFMNDAFTYWPLTLPGGLRAGATRYFTVGLELPTWPLSGTSGGGNAYQGEQAVFPLTWHIDY